jgi:hypothetical protein
MTKALIIVVALAAGCKKERSKLDTAPTPSTTSPAGSASAPAAPAPTAIEAEAQTFCEKTMQKVLTCFDDAAFWDVFATTFFAKYPDTTGNPDAKKQWIGMRKDDLVGLKQDKQLAENCTVMVRSSVLPTADDMKTVNAAMAKSCTDFGTAMGFMLFHKGVFHTPR